MRNFQFVSWFWQCRLHDDVHAEVIAWEASMHGLIYLIGLIVVIMFILSLLGLR
jgi:hypothetical protein